MDSFERRIAAIRKAAGKGEALPVPPVKVISKDQLAKGKKLKQPRRKKPEEPIRVNRVKVEEPGFEAWIRSRITTDDDIIDAEPARETLLPDIRSTFTEDKQINIPLKELGYRLSGCGIRIRMRCVFPEGFFGEGDLTGRIGILADDIPVNDIIARSRRSLVEIAHLSMLPTSALEFSLRSPLRLPRLEMVLRALGIEFSYLTERPFALREISGRIAFTPMPVPEMSPRMATGWPGPDVCEQLANPRHIRSSSLSPEAFEIPRSDRIPAGTMPPDIAGITAAIAPSGCRLDIAILDHSVGWICSRTGIGADTFPTMLLMCPEIRDREMKLPEQPSGMSLRDLSERLDGLGLRHRYILRHTVSGLDEVFDTAEVPDAAALAERLRAGGGGLRDLRPRPPATPDHKTAPGEGAGTNVAAANAGSDSVTDALRLLGNKLKKDARPPARKAPSVIPDIVQEVKRSLPITTRVTTKTAVEELVGRYRAEMSGHRSLSVISLSQLIRAEPAGLDMMRVTAGIPLKKAIDLINAASSGLRISYVMMVSERLNTPPVRLVLPDFNLEEILILMRTGMSHLKADFRKALESFDDRSKNFDTAQFQEIVRLLGGSLSFVATAPDRPDLQFERFETEPELYSDLRSIEENRSEIGRSLVISRPMSPRHDLGQYAGQIFLQEAARVGVGEVPGTARILARLGYELRFLMRLPGMNGNVTMDAAELQHEALKFAANNRGRPLTLKEMMRNAGQSSVEAGFVAHPTDGWRMPVRFSSILLE